MVCILIIPYCLFSKVQILNILPKIKHINPMSTNIVNSPEYICPAHGRIEVDRFERHNLTQTTRPFSFCSKHSCAPDRSVSRADRNTPTFRTVPRCHCPFWREKNKTDYHNHIIRNSWHAHTNALSSTYRYVDVQLKTFGNFTCCV